MARQKKMVTVTEDTTVLDRARKRLKIGEIVHYKDENLKKVKGGWEKVSDDAYTHLVIVLV